MSEKAERPLRERIEEAIGVLIDYAVVRRGVSIDNTEKASRSARDLAFAHRLLFGEHLDLAAADYYRHVLSGGDPEDLPLGGDPR